MERFTTNQVNDQQQRFDSFVASANLAKIGKGWLNYLINDNHDGRYNNYNYIHRVLRLKANVKGAMYHPETMTFYSEILTRAALNAYIATLK